MTLSKARANEIHSIFNGQTFMQTLQARLVDVTSGHAVIEAPVLPEASQHHGYAHAGVTFTLGDTAGGCAAATVMDGGKTVLTAEIKINLLAPATGPLLRATGTVIKPGRRLVIVTSLVQSIDDDKITDVALLQGTMVPV